MKLSKKEIKFLSSSFQVESPLSIFANINDAPDGSEYQSLLAKGVIVGDSYNPEDLNLLMMLTNPSRCARFILQNSFFLIEKYTYRVGNDLILAQNNEGEMDFEILSDTSEISIKLSDVLGMSRISTSDISDVFTPGEMTVTLAMIDISRKRNMLSYADAPVNNTAMTVDTINAEIASPYKNGLVEIFLKNYKLAAPRPEHTLTLLESLVKKGVVQYNGGYTLSTNYDHFAHNFLIPESIVMYETMDLLPNGEVAVVARVAITAGLHEIITFLFDGDLVEINTVSAAQLLTNIEDFMSCPEIKAVSIPSSENVTPVPAVQTTVSPAVTEQVAVQPTAQTLVQPATQDDGTWVCQCSKVNTGNFCASCGSKKP